MQVLITSVAHVPDLRYHLFSLSTLVKDDRTFEGRPTRVLYVVRLTSERSIMFPLSGTLYSLHRYRIDRSSKQKAGDVLPPRQLPNKPAMNTNDFPCATGYSHAIPLRKTPKQQGVVLPEELLECEGGLHGEGSLQKHQAIHEHKRR